MLFVAVAKNPYAWLLAMHRHPVRPRAGDASLKISFAYFVREPWRFDDAERAVEGAVPAALSNVVQLWNVKYRALLALEKVARALPTIAELAIVRCDDGAQSPPPSSREAAARTAARRSGRAA